MFDAGVLRLACYCSCPLCSKLTLDDEDAELRALFARTVLFARLNPGQKAR